MMDEPIVSIIMPTYNRAFCLNRAVESVLRQTYHDFELIIIDDGSTDDTTKVINGFSDKRIVHLRHEKNMGAAAARNLGIQMAKGDFIAFQDSDDVWHPEKLSRQMEAFKKKSSDIGVVYAGAWRIENGKKILIPYSRIYNKEGELKQPLLVENFITLPSAIVRKECFSVAGMFDESLPCLQDWELWIRISNHYRFKYIDEPLVNAYFSNNSISYDYQNISRAWRYVLIKHFKEFEKDKKILTRWYVSMANYLCSFGDIAEGRRYLTKALIVYPLNIKIWALILLSLLGQRVYKAMFITACERKRKLDQERG